MIKEADKLQWDMFTDLTTGEDLDRATRTLHDTINEVMDGAGSSMDNNKSKSKLLRKMDDR